jgi:ribose transport system ATP-binding protein
MDMKPVLSVGGLHKRFGSVDALTEVEFSLKAGEVRALLGVNGAGKSTFVKVLSGLIRKDRGTISIAGEVSDISGPHDAGRLGIASVQQHPELVSELSGYENVFLGREAKGAVFAKMDRGRLRRAAQALAKEFDLRIDLDVPVREMSAIERELVAILQALANEHIRILILDEPTSVLTEGEKAMLFEVIRSLKRRGIAVIYITHRLDEVFEIADSFTVFRGGRVIETAQIRRELHDAERIAELMLGARLGDVYPARMPQPGPVLLEAQDVSRRPTLDSVSFALQRGEVLGIFGLLGSGLDELSKLLFGALPADGGTLLVGGKPVRMRSPKEALRHGIFLVPGDRRAEGLTPTEDVAFNTTLANLGRVSVLGGLLRQAKARRETIHLAGQVDLQPPDTRRPVTAFSGGNQQKVVIAKGLFAQAAIYIFVEPTVGVDIGARAKIYSLIRELSRTSAVLIMSSDCDEIYGLSDRIITLYKGRQTLSAKTDDISREQVMLAGLSGDMGRRAA